MTDYKETLNLPKTGFPMKANLAQREPQILQRWAEQNLYSQRVEQRQQAKAYTLHDGPPYANGNIHVGHAINKTLKDIICRAKYLSGFHTPYVPGWDCHGLPIEVNVEKKIGKAGVKVSANDFRQACREYAKKQVDIQKIDFQRLGVLGEWDNPYLTMNFGFEANVIRALQAIVGKGYLKQGFRPIHWCFSCQSSLAEAEVEYQDKTSPSIDVKFTVKDEAAFVAAFDAENVGQGDISIVIWTTTPWTLPANKAVALHPELDYALVQVGDERYLLAHEMVSGIMERYGIEHYEVLGMAKGVAFEHQLLQHPFLAQTSMIVLGEHVTTDAGTGAVHTAPAHGEDDFRVGKQYDLPVDSPVQANGVFSDELAEFAGQFVFKANAAIIECLQSNKALVHSVELQHSYPHCWRHKTPVIFRATPQWFISMESLATDAIAAVDNIQWKPAWGKERMLNMLTDRPDWCISRQRAWGVPIALFTHKDTNELHPNTVEIMSRVADEVEKGGVEAWFDCDVKALLGADAQDYVKCNDVLDVWFDSGVTHFCVLSVRDNLQFPADCYLEGSDQYRGWFQTALLTSMAINGVAPYRDLVTHGFAVDGKGRKMSKSVGNVIAPEKIIKQYGADVLRLWIASTDFSGELAVSDEILKRSADIYRRLRNTARFLLSNLADFDQTHAVPAEQMTALDRWVVARARDLQKEIIADYDAFNFHNAMQKIHHFCSIELGSFYLDIIKDRQYTCQASSAARRSAQTAMHHVLETLVRWIAPVLCFTADEIWQFLPGERSTSIHLETWYDETSIGYQSDFDDSYWRKMMQVRDQVNQAIEKARCEGVVGSSLEAEVVIYCGEEDKAFLEALADELRFVLITSSASVQLSEKQEDEITVSVLASAHEKCERCWHRRDDVNANSEYPNICSRCVENIVGEGEQRQFA